jgi:hypothetical protein
MVRIRCETAKFFGAGRFLCHRCGQEMSLPPDCWVVLMMLPDHMMAWDADTGATLHKCRNLLMRGLDYT